jgi:hypothetical protein
MSSLLTIIPCILQTIQSIYSLDFAYLSLQFTIWPVEKVFHSLLLERQVLRGQPVENL